MANEFNLGECHALRIIASHAGFPGRTYHTVKKEIAKLQNDNTRLAAENERLRKALEAAHKKKDTP